jgi:taurine dioxygenase
MIDGAREQPLHGNLKAVSDLPYRKAEEAKSMSLNMQPLSDKFGVAITNVDLSKDIDQSLFNEIVDAFVKKQVLVFRDQHIEPQHQVAFSRRFGPLEMLYDEDQRVPGFPEVAILSNEKVDGKFIGVVAAGDADNLRRSR